MLRAERFIPTANSIIAVAHDTEPEGCYLSCVVGFAVTIESSPATAVLG